MGVGPLPASAIRNSADRMKLDEREETVFMAVMRWIDRSYLRAISRDIEGNGSGGKTEVVTRPATIELFDALFG